MLIEKIQFSQVSSVLRQLNVQYEHNNEIAVAKLV